MSNDKRKPEPSESKKDLTETLNLDDMAFGEDDLDDDEEGIRGTKALSELPEQGQTPALPFDMSAVEPGQGASKPSVAEKYDLHPNAGETIVAGDSLREQIMPFLQKGKGPDPNAPSPAAATEPQPPQPILAPAPAPVQPHAEQPAPLPPAPVPPAAAVAAEPAPTPQASPWANVSEQQQVVPPPTPDVIPPDPLAAKAQEQPVQTAPVEVELPQAEPAKARRKPRDNEVLQLVWYDPEPLPRIRRERDWAEILDDMETREPEPEVDDAFEELADMEERREITELLCYAPAADPRFIKELLSSAVGEGGRFTRPLLMLEGELLLGFDEFDTVRATIETLRPLSAGDEELETTIDDIDKVLDGAQEHAAPAVAEGFLKRLRQAGKKVIKLLTQEQFDQQVERGLLNGRCYRLREVFGDMHLRALLQTPGTTDPAKGIPAYFPEDVAQELPMFRRFGVRMIAELHLAADQYETHPAALRVLAMARVVVKDW